MEVVLGSALLSISVLIVTYVGKLKRMPMPPRWTNSNALLNIVIFCTIAGIVFGVALLVAGLFEFRSLEFGALEAGLLATAVAATFVAGLLIRSMGRVKTTRTKLPAKLPTVTHQSTQPAAMG